MHTLHGVWLPDAFFLFCRKDEQILPVTQWTERLFAGDDSEIIESGKVGVRTFQLPTISATETDSGRRPPALTLQQINGVAISIQAAYTFLTSLSSEQMAERGYQLADDLRFWKRVTLFALELVKRGRYTPTIVINKAKSYGFGVARPGWRPNVELAGDQQRIHLLALAMPPICRSYDPKGAEGWIHEDPRDILLSYIEQIMSILINQWGTNQFAARQAIPFRGGTTLAAQWFHALLTKSGDATLFAATSELRKLSAQIAEWTNRKMPTQPMRLFFRLEPPVEDDAWKLHVYLQSIADPSRFLAAADIWQQHPHLEGLLLAELSEAAGFFEKLDEIRNQPAPDCLQLTIEEAYQFLREAAEKLQDNGFGVQVPVWWSRRNQSRLGITLRIKQPEYLRSAPAAASSFGLSQLLEFDAQVAMDEQELTADELQQLAEAKLPLIRLRGEWKEVNAADIARLYQYVTEKPQRTLRMSELLYLMAEEEEAPITIEHMPKVKFSMPTVLRNLLEGKMTEELANRVVPDTFKGKLRPYQQVGYAWLATMTEMGFGVCLADDMGLGKTIQLITLLLSVQKSKPALIICPTSLVHNWRNELSRFAPSLRVMVHHGQQRVHGQVFSEQAQLHDVVISTYSLTSRDEQNFASLIWSYLVLDESQYIKNSASKQARSVMAIKAEHRVALTGTPVENRLQELWSLFHFLNPGYLGTQRQFHTRFAVPIERERRKDRTQVLHQLTRPFILRRVKTDPAIIQELPEKIEQKTYCTLTSEQVSLYQATVTDMLEQIRTADGIKRRGLVLASLTRLKQICNHPALFLGDRFLQPGRSGKLQRLREIVGEILENGEAVLMFTQYVEMGQMIARFLEAEFAERCLFLHGGVKQQAREEMIQSFQTASGPNLFVLSLKAGGVGLNLTKANHVIHFDRWWNHAVENQATDRAYRIGQNKNVLVHTFICQGTLEERIDELIESKKNLADQVIGTGENWLTELSVGELTQLFTLRDELLVEEEGQG